MLLVCHNGKMLDATQPLFTASNRSFRYGDGFFETMKYAKGKICLQDLHFERLFRSLKILEFDAAHLTEKILEQNIQELGNGADNARIRLAVYREENAARYVIEHLPLNAEAGKWNEKGMRIDIHPFVRKSCDGLSSLKTANHLPYVMAALYAEKHGLDECIVLNTEGNICDGSRSNIFLIKNNEIITPALGEGCIAGVMRRHVIDVLKKNGFIVQQLAVTESMLENADSVFITNAIMGIKWVRNFRGGEYASAEVKKIFGLFDFL
jgi:branched-chain amino acid aminotransferase